MIGREFEVPDWDLYSMDLKRPFDALEPTNKEMRIVGGALARSGMRGSFQPPNTTTPSTWRYVGRSRMHSRSHGSISPRVQRLIYAINAIHRPAVMIAAGVFCGYTFISNAGAAVGPDGVYSARALIGLQINHLEAERAERNVRRIDPSGVARILGEDGVDFCAAWKDTIDLLYLDADGDRGRGKGIYLEITEKAWDKARWRSHTRGCVEEMAMYSGQSVADIRDIISARDRVRSFVGQFRHAGPAA